MPSGRASGPIVLHDAEVVMNSLRRVLVGLRTWAGDAESRAGISGAQVFVLEKIAEAPGQSLTALAERTLTSKAAVSVVVSKLVERGLVRRQPSREDGRSVELDLTAAGRRMLLTTPESPAGHVVAAMKRLPRADLAELARLMEGLVAELGIAGVEPKLMFEGEAGEAQASSARRRTPAARRSS